MFLGNRLGVCVAALAVCFSVSLPAADVPNAASQELLQVDAQRVEAMLSGDVVALGRLLSDELTYVGDNGRAEDKQSLLYALKNKLIVYQQCIATERKARVMGSSGIVTGVAAMRGVDRKDGFDVGARYTAVYARREGRWQLVAFQATPLPGGGRVIAGESA